MLCEKMKKIYPVKFDIFCPMQVRIFELFRFAVRRFQNAPTSCCTQVVVTRYPSYPTAVRRKNLFFFRADLSENLKSCLTGPRND